MNMISNREPFKFEPTELQINLQRRSAPPPAKRQLLPFPSLMAPRTTTNLHQRATSGVMAPRKTSDLHHERATAGVVAPLTKSSLDQHATAVLVTPRTTSNLDQCATTSVVEPPRTTTGATAGLVAPRTTSNQRQRAPADARGEPPNTLPCRAVERPTATHDFVVIGYSKLKMLGVGQYISSDAFRAGGHDWEIRFYPKMAKVQGKIADCRPPFFPGGASLHLCDADKDTELTVRFTLSVLQQDRLVSPMASRTTMEIFGAPPLQCRHGFNKLVDGSMLRPQQCIHNDALTIRCTLTVVCVKDLVPPPTSNLDQHATAGGVVMPRTTCHLHQPATVGVVAPSTTSNIPAGGDARGEETPKTTSWRVVKRETATQDFVVTEYSKVTTLGVGQYVSSDAFRAGDHDWKIRFYPKPPLAMGGLDKYRPPLFPGGAGLHLCDADEDTELTVKFTLSVLHRSGRVSPLASRTAKRIFGAPALWREHYGFHRLVDENESDMPNLWRCIRNDALTIRCTLTVVGSRDPVAPPERAAHPSPLLGTGMDADVTFQVGGRAFPAHRAILAARSPVFSAELFGDMMEKDALCIKIVGMRPEVFELLLQFIYTEALPGDGDGCDAPTMQHLLVAADRYGLDRLKHICELKLHYSVDAETVASMLALAECHNCPRLRDVCVACMSETISCY